MLNFLATAGHVGLIGSGARLVLQGFEHATGIPIYSALRDTAAQAVGDVRSLATPVLEALGGPELAALADPAKQFRTVGDVPRRPLVAGEMSLQDYAKKANRKAKAAEDKLAAYEAAAAQAEAQRVLDEANGRANAAEQRARDLDAQLAKAKTDAQRRQLKLKSRGARRWAQVSRAFSGQANQAAQKAAADPTAGNMQAVLDLALKALSASQAAQNPPADARHVLADDRYNDAEKSAAQYAIDGVNREDAFNVEEIVARLSSDDDSIREQAEGDLVDVAEISGHDGHHHDHAPGACSCKGTCGACSAKPKLAGKSGGSEDSWDYPSGATTTLAGGDGNAWEDSAWDDPTAARRKAPALAGAEAEPMDDFETNAKPSKVATAGPANDDPWAYGVGDGGKADAAFLAKLDRMGDDEDCGCGG